MTFLLPALQLRAEMKKMVVVGWRKVTEVKQTGVRRS